MKRSSEKTVRYYERYAHLVSETLRDPLFQTVLHGIIQNENIEIDKIKDIQVKIFPFTKENGNRLAGKCTDKGVISIYPKGVSFCQKLMIDWREDTVSFYIKCRARATLIHEILHVKYMDKEFKVRELTRKYFIAFIRRKKPRKKNQMILQKLFPKIIPKNSL